MPVDAHSYFAFLFASILLILIPGASQALVLARTLSGGTRAGILTAVGLNVGTLFHALAAGLGLSALLATSAVAFSAVKWAGAGYLVYLGVQALRAPTGATVGGPQSAQAGSGFVQAVATGILNPKVAIFFLAFLPQFVDPARGSAVVQFLFLGASMAVLDTLYETTLVLLVARARDRLLANDRFDRWRNRVAGTVLIGLGARLALQHRP
jgi:threonine/homoserine/homoserine lactone efflux protein